MEWIGENEDNKYYLTFLQKKYVQDQVKKKIMFTQ